MKYMGSKRRIASEILPIMLAERGDRPWVEPFVGGGNMIDCIKGGLIIGADANRYTIEALISIRDHVDELPKNNTEFTEDDYKKLKTSDNYPHKGFAGFQYSFGSKWLGGWARDKDNRDYVRCSYALAVKQSPYLQDKVLINCDYKELNLPDNSLIYCDPPYRGTTKYKSSINYEEFWQWVRWRELDGHIVFVSEYNAPDDFDCIWSKEITTNLDNQQGKKLKPVEKLFRLNKF